MKAGGDILVLGKALEGEFARLQQTLPLGMELRKVSDQPAAVKTGVGEFVKVLVEALVIVLAVSFFSVSYTHLDVYKRQPWNRSACATPISTRCICCRPSCWHVAGNANRRPRALWSLSLIHI